MIKILGQKSKEAFFLSKDSFNQNYKDNEYIFLNLNKCKVSSIYKIVSKYKKRNNQIIIMLKNNNINNFKKLKKYFVKNKFNIKIIWPILKNNKQILKIFTFSNGNLYKTNFHIFNSYKQTHLQRVWNIRGSFPYETDSTPYSPEDIKEYTLTPDIKVYDDVINNLILSLFKIKNNFLTKYKIKFLNIFFILKFFPEQKFLNQLFYSPIKLMMRIKRISKRYCDIFIMIFLIFLFPKYLYKFSTRNVLPANNNKFKFDKQIFNKSIIIDKKNFQNIKVLNEANIILRGSSIQNLKIKNKSLPTFLVSCLAPQELQNLSSIFSKNLITKSKIVYPSLSYLKAFIKINYLKKMKLGNAKEKFKTLFIDGYENVNYSKEDEKFMLKNKNYCKKKQIQYLRAFKNFFPKKPTQSNYLPSGSGLLGIYAIKSFVKKINVYGWDYHLKSDPNKFSSSLLFLISNINYDLEYRGMNYFEGLLINLFYGSELSKDKNIKIYGHLGHLQKHQYLIKNIGKVIFKY